MRGWIYVISNKTMPGRVKIGYSLKDPEERAQEFDSTGMPHPYIVEYDILIEGELFEVAQRIHRTLSSYLEGEWFHCTPEQAVMKIREITKGIAIAESFKKTDREKAESLEHEGDLEIAMQREKTKIEEDRLQHEREINMARQPGEAKLIEKEPEITQNYGNLSKEKFPTHGIKSSLISWLVFSILVVLLAPRVFPKMALDRALCAIVISGFGLAILFTLIWNNRQRNKQTKWVESAKYDSWDRTRAAASERLKQVEGNVDPSDIRCVSSVQKAKIEEVQERMGADKKHNGEKIKGIRNVKVGVRVSCSKCFKQYSVSLTPDEGRAICPFCGGLTTLNIK